VRSFRDRNPYAVGIVSVLLLGAATGFAFLVGVLNLLEDTYEAEGVFTDAAGLRTGDDVRVAGMRVGRVTAVDADRDEGNVVVTFVVDRGVDIGDGAGADIALATLLGGNYVRISEPTRGDDVLEDLPRDQRVIPVERTTTPVDVFRLTRDATEAIEETETDQLNQLILQLTAVTEGRRPALVDLIDGIERTSRAINERDVQLSALLDEADELAANLADKDQALVALIDQGARALDVLIERRDLLAAALGEGSAAVQSLSAVISTNKDAIDAILDDLHPTLAVVDAHLETLNPTLAVIGPAFLNQAKAGRHGPWQEIFVAGMGPDVLAIYTDLLSQVLDQ
jgi:phospholipid/cholesterol/gamma-HCH transport system substrate-binding protein